MLLGLLGLPAVWYVLRSDPLKPVDVEFGPMFLLEQLDTSEAQPNQMPWWKQALFLGAAATAVVAAADPHSNTTPNFAKDGPILIAMDSGWASAHNWNDHREAVHELIRHANNQDRNIVFLNMAEGENGEPVQLTRPMNAALALSYIDNIMPVPWESDRKEAVKALDSLSGTFGATFWMSNGLQDDQALPLSEALSDFAPLTVYDEPDTPYLMMPPVYRNGNYDITVKRASVGEVTDISISAYDEGRNLIGTAPATFGENQAQTRISFNAGDYNISADQIFKFSVDNENSAGSMALVNENYKPRSVGIAVRNQQLDTESLLSEARFLQAALKPHTEVYFGSIEELIDSNDISALIIPDAMPLNTVTHEKVLQWTRNGGQTIRFAGPNLVDEAHVDDPLLPVDLRKGTRAMVDSVIAADDEGLRLQQFDNDSPYTGIDVDKSVATSRQVVVDPSPDLEEKIWARFSDGSPLVTAEGRGGGQVVLFHTTANTSWSKLPLSNNFVDILVATIGQSNSIEDMSDYELQDLAPRSILNARGELRDPNPVVAPLNQSVLDDGVLSAAHPPGLYGTSLMTVPYNISHVVEDVKPLQAMPEGVARENYSNLSDDNHIQGWLWSGAVGLLMAGSLLLASAGHSGRRKEKGLNNNADHGKRRYGAPPAPGQ